MATLQQVWESLNWHNWFGPVGNWHCGGLLLSGQGPWVWGAGFADQLQRTNAPLGKCPETAGSEQQRNNYCCLLSIKWIVSRPLLRSMVLCGLQMLYRVCTPLTCQLRESLCDTAGELVDNQRTSAHATYKWPSNLTKHPADVCSSTGTPTVTAGYRHGVPVTTEIHQFTCRICTTTILI
jgi:hypothetical protein